MPLNEQISFQARNFLHKIGELGESFFIYRLLLDYLKSVNP